MDSPWRRSLSPVRPAPRAAERICPLHIAEALTEPSQHGDALNELVRAEQVRLLYRELPLSVGANMVGTLVLSGLMWAVVPHRHIVGWVAFMALSQAWRISHYFRFQRRAREIRKLDTWAGLWALGALVSGCTWGAASFVMSVPDSPMHQALLLALVFGVTSAAVLLIGAHAPSFYAFVVPALLPVVVKNALAGTPAHFTLALIAGISTLAILSFGRHYSRVLVESLRNRFHIEALARELSQQNRELEKARAEAELARSAAEVANRAKTNFFAAASHDLRQPLHALGLFAAALSEKVRDPEVMQVVNSVNASVEALEGLFNELLDISKIDAGAIKPNVVPFGLTPLLERLRMDFEPVAFERGLALRVRPNSAYVMSDALLVERILRNLIGNALRYTAAGGVLVGARRRGRDIVIEVRDSGPGIPPGEQERVFEEFYQIGNAERHSKRGLGLGLSIVRRLANLLHAKLVLRSQLGRGSVFTLYLPLSAAPVPGGPAVPLAGLAAGSLAGNLIVVVEDESAVLEGMKVLLEGWGAAVVAASSTAAALELVSMHERCANLIIADHRLREGHDGIEAIRALRSHFGRDIPAIIVSGNSALLDLNEAKTLGAHFLLKPVMPARLRTLINYKLKETA